MVHGAFKSSSLLCSTGFRRFLTLNVNERSWYTYDGIHINIILFKRHLEVFKTFGFVVGSNFEPFRFKFTQQSSSIKPPAFVSRAPRGGPLPKFESKPSFSAEDKKKQSQIVINQKIKLK